MGPAFWPNGVWPAGQWPSNIWPFPPASPVAAGTKMSAATFPFAYKFPNLYKNGKAPLVDFACATIEVEWSGIFSLWQNDTAALQAQKQFNLEAYLVAWWLADMNPEDAQVQGDGGMPLTSKSIGGVSISRKDMGLQAGMKQLESNVFGLKAAALFLSAPERMTIARAKPTASQSIPIPLVFPGWPTS